MTGSSRKRSATVVSICVTGFLLVAAVPPVAAADAVGQTAQPEADNTVTRVHVYPNGSAQWTIQIRTRLDTDGRVAEYEAFQERFRANTSQYRDPFRQRMQGVVANAANTTGRELRVENVTASTTIQQVPRRWGVVTYQFTWTGFAAQRNESLVVGDVFQGGFFLTANDTLEFEAPAGYDIARLEPSPAARDGGVVTFLGREGFADRRPRVVFSPVTEPRQSDGQAATPGGTASSPLAGIGPGIVLGGGLLLALLGFGVYAGWRRRDDAEQPSSSAASVDVDAPAQAETGEDVSAAATATDTAVMTDTERVRELLEANGGRMRQAAIADEFDWSASKTSRVIGRMVDEKTVEKLQLGRENLIELGASDE